MKIMKIMKTTKTAKTTQTTTLTMFVLPVLLALLFAACGESTKKSNTASTGDPSATEAQAEAKQPGYQTCWEGTKNGKPLFIEYQIDEEVVIGQITYLNAKATKSFLLLGTIDEENACQLKELDRQGNLKEYIRGKINNNEMTGKWVNSSGDKLHDLSLTRADTLITSPEIRVNPEEVFGKYLYSNKESDHYGNLFVEKGIDNRIQFEINNSGGYNTAIVDRDFTTLTGHSFTYEMPYSEDHEFRTRFYKDFAYIDLGKGDRWGTMFGIGAHIDLFYVKQPELQTHFTPEEIKKKMEHAVKKMNSASREEQRWVYTDIVGEDLLKLLHNTEEEGIPMKDWKRIYGKPLKTTAIFRYN